ncbi:MerR family transcriptional regulator [Streptomyces sp. HUCO-GS316]|uniref:MerR family transcriptional regulator n=1 Tax=Streptomyces sp. HUCO-GS316 TaxID=2692198 RepID=UPI001F1BCF2F|nr:MerR family transcriptional regulator [Streptomyces sp. HUCO-GS316]
MATVLSLSGSPSPPPRTATGQRRYGPDEIARVRVIRELLGLGLTVEDLPASPTGSSS